MPPQTTHVHTALLSLLAISAFGCIDQLTPYASLEGASTLEDMAQPGDLTQRDVEGSEDDADTDMMIREVHVALAEKTLCLLHDAQIWCRGLNAHGELGQGHIDEVEGWVQVEPFMTWTELEAGSSHFCAIDSRQEAWCWGSNQEGQTGDVGDPGPRRVELAQPVRKLFAGHDSSCAITDSGRAWCWGRNSENKLTGGDTTLPVEDPVELPLVDTVQAWSTISIGVGHLCALDTTERMWCRGGNANMMTAPNSSMIRVRELTAVDALPPWEQVSCGSKHTCGIRAGELWCWGRVVIGQALDDSETVYPAPTRVFGPHDGFVAIESDTFHACALDRAGALACWGRTIEGQLGAHLQQDEILPTWIPFDEQVWQVSLSRFATCVKTTSNVVCAGLEGDSSWTAQRLPDFL